MKVLFVLTSHDKLGDTGQKTGFWIEEFAAPYYTLADAGVKVDMASPKGGQPPIDPKSTEPDSQTKATRRFYEDDDLQHKLSKTKKLSDVRAEDYDAVFYPGGHGPLWDLASDQDSIRLIEDFTKQQKPVAAVCHGPAVLLQAKGADGEPLVKGKKVAGFTNSEEEAVQLTEVVPFLIEDRMKELGGHYSKGGDWQPHVVTDGLLITGQNPASSEPAAEELLKLLKK
ncbi:type 1 glutamine amidotransferase domain-containing protein [Pontibacter sp. JH31]|uniref:Type 1 glutamine amidotransferase domain-containing protein n=1 Tax=Pontibacter aquaedesilientis TaxID=2766980 RepID=A0ABR7XH09_9BACT|nr:type 1 glutamine amidotransferase domain-containing protein [Pontibacter aquaedesilientis]MBD1397553.1 type 1 glutamine amidotransferase domain-containing protein [Pontibacter aquaedesilientis]